MQDSYSRTDMNMSPGAHYIALSLLFFVKRYSNIRAYITFILLIYRITSVSSNLILHVTTNYNKSLIMTI